MFCFYDITAIKFWNANQVVLIWRDMLLQLTFPASDEDTENWQRIVHQTAIWGSCAGRKHTDTATTTLHWVLFHEDLLYSLWCLICHLKPECSCNSKLKARHREKKQSSFFHNKADLNIYRILYGLHCSTVPLVVKDILRIPLNSGCNHEIIFQGINLHLH